MTSIFPQGERRTDNIASAHGWKVGLRGCAGRVARAGIGSSGARWEKGAAGPRGRVSRAGIGSSGEDARTPPVVMCGEVADLEIEGKGEGGWPAAPRILKRREVAAAPIQRACSPIPWLQPLLQSICLFFLFSNQSGRIPSTSSPSKSSWLFFRLPASTPSRSCTGSSSSPLLSLCSVDFAYASARLLARLLVLGIGALLCWYLREFVVCACPPDACALLCFCFCMCVCCLLLGLCGWPFV